MSVYCVAQDCSFPAYFYTQPMATGPGFYDNLCPQSWQDGSAATFTLQDPHQQSKDQLSAHLTLHAHLDAHALT